MKAANPSFSVGDIAKSLGKKWEACTNRAKFEAMAAKAKAQYEKVRKRFIQCCFFTRIVCRPSGPIGAKTCRPGGLTRYDR